VRPRLALIAGFGLVAAAVARALRLRQPLALPSPEPWSPTDDRADELRRKLAESRPLVDERARFEGAETTVDAAEPVLGDPDERRRLVHGEARAAVEQMQQAAPADES